MNFKKIFLFFLVIIFQTIFAQKEGYWDKERVTTKEITISGGDRAVIKIENLPVGTTELVYRITLLDKNQQLTNSLISGLKSIADPARIGQGPDGAAFLVSKISDEDQCTYGLFTSNEKAKKYIEDGEIGSACYAQKKPLSKDAKRLSLDSSPCLKDNLASIWFGFESKNWLLSQKIVLEVVPWVDVNLSRGWHQDNKKEIIGLCKTSNMAQKMVSSDDFCVCILDKIMREYRFAAFQKLLAIEKTKIYKDFGNACYHDTIISENVFNDLRKQANILIKKHKYNEAIPKLNLIIKEKKATVFDYNAIGYAYILTKQYGKAIKFLKEGEKVDGTELWIKLNLAHAYLINDDYANAKPIYKKYQNQNVTDSLSWRAKIKIDFDNFERQNLPSKNFGKVKKLLE